MYHLSRNPSLTRVRLPRLRPTQFAVGYEEVKLKAEQWSRMGKKQRKIEEGIEAVWVTVLDDLSWLDPAVFWRTLEFRSWSHPYDHRGQRRDYREMPRRLTELEDDPYRSLAGLARAAGGFAKDQAPFVEFMWADYFRTRVPVRTIKKQPARATREGLRLARASDARYLPGWSGQTAKPV